jgi:hypothetical protein
LASLAVPGLVSCFRSVVWCGVALYTPLCAIQYVKSMSDNFNSC